MMPSNEDPLISLNLANNLKEIRSRLGNSLILLFVNLSW